MTAPRPCSPAEAVAIARSLVGTGIYELGTGDCDTPTGGESDCFGFAFDRCYGVRRHRPGFNRGDWATISDDLNCNSAIEDADHHRELFVRVADLPLGDALGPARPQLGDLIAYPTIHLPGHPQPFIGHIAIVIGISRVVEWDPSMPDWHMLDVAQCCGPPGRHPAILATDASHWNQRDHDWPKPEHRSVLLRVVP